MKDIGPPSDQYAVIVCIGSIRHSDQGKSSYDVTVSTEADKGKKRKTGEKR